LIFLHAVFERASRLTSETRERDNALVDDLEQVLMPPAATSNACSNWLALLLPTILAALNDAPDQRNHHTAAAPPD
jgi:hypothetical protein